MSSNLKMPNLTPDSTLIKFVEEFLGTVTSLMEKGLQNLQDFEYKSGFTLSVETWHKVLKVVPQNEIPKLRLDLVPEEHHSKKEFYLKGRFSDLIHVFKIVSKRLVDLLSKSSQSTSPVKRFFVNQVPTYGIYSPANSQETDKKLHEWSIKQGVCSQLTLPSNAKVLLCLGMQPGLEEQVSNDTSFQGDVAQIASLFQLCVLIHEHFHAILETGLDTTGHTSVSTSDPDDWKKALPLNESLAVWMELHFARLYASTYLQGLIKDYIQAGNYPDWPYRGAEYLEKIFQDQGLSAIQSWIDMIRKNPYLAQDKFDNLITQ